MNNLSPAALSPALYALLGIVLTKLVDWGIARGTRSDTYTAGLRADIADLRDEVAAKDTRLDALEKSLDEVRKLYRDREDHLYRRIGQLEGRIASLERYIQHHGLEVPRWAKEDGTS